MNFDILTFIQDDAQREYLSGIKYNFSAIEAAYIVCNSDRDLREKYDAVNYIIDTFPDCALIADFQVEYSSALDYLKEYNSIIEKYYNKFFAKPDESEYFLQVWYIGQHPEDWVSGLYSFDDVLDELGTYDHENEFTFKVRREWENDYVELDHSPEGHPYKLSFKGTPEEHECLSIINKVYVNFWTI